MDEQIRKLQIRADQGDLQARRLLDHKLIQSGQTPSLDYVADVLNQAIRVTQDHLYHAARELALGFLKSNPRIAVVRWESYESWELGGVTFVFVDDLVDGIDYVTITEGGFSEFEFEDLVYHLSRKCQCYNLEGGLGTYGEAPFCSFIAYPSVLTPEEIDQLQDLYRACVQFFEKINTIPWQFLPAWLDIYRLSFQLDFDDPAS